MNKISINDVVLIEDSRLRRSEWRVGRVSELIKSNDGHVRTAVVNVINENGKQGQLRRPINKLYPVEQSMRNNEVDKSFDEQGVPIIFVDENTIPLASQVKCSGIRLLTRGSVRLP